MNLGALLPCHVHAAVAAPSDHRQLQCRAGWSGDFVDLAVARAEIVRCPRKHSTNPVSQFGMPEQVDGFTGEGDHWSIGDYSIRVSGHWR
jgi:hypothetical protein